MRRESKVGVGALRGVDKWGEVTKGEGRRRRRRATREKFAEGEREEETP